MLPFSISRLPRIEFGPGVFDNLRDILPRFGQRLLLITGGRSFQSTPYWQDLQEMLKQQHIDWEHCRVNGEPSPQFVDETVKEFSRAKFDVVLGIGGGSALDAAKAIAGLLRLQRSVMDYLEGVGPELTYEGPAIPFVAVPTTAGTGSEATKNAVLSVQGQNGFKKSFRHEKLVAQYAVVDPRLLASCPQTVIAANGMDALTQLIESYVSVKANTFTDALTISGLRAIRDGLLPWYKSGPTAETAQAKMGYAALISGITLAQVGLGSVHGLASPLGAFYPIPHGVVCGTLVAAATDVNIQSMCQREPENPALDRYARVAEVLWQQRHSSREIAWQALIDLLTDWTKRLNLPRLSQYNITADGLDHIITHSRGSSMKTNPIDLTEAEIRSILAQRL